MGPGSSTFLSSNFNSIYGSQLIFLSLCKLCVFIVFFYRVIFIRFFCNSQNCIGLVYRVFKFFIGLRCIRLFNGVSKSIGLKYRVLVVYRVFEIEPNFLELKKNLPKLEIKLIRESGKKAKKK